ncbi:MAG TPA: hypothetical protein VK604_04325 [Bryobacteraceae bacterium]|nr:hypothetical protein [Bryobacteraceae bacterium]
MSLSLATPPATSQILLKPAQEGETVMLMPSDMAILEAADGRKDLPCTVLDRKAELGFDLRFHSGFDVTLPLRELAGDSQLLTVVFRAYAVDNPTHPVYFVQHFQVPTVEEDAKGDATLQGGMDVGEGKYHIDWLMRDKSERICSSSWEVEATLSPKDKPMPLFIAPNHIAESSRHPFLDDATSAGSHSSQDNLNVKLLVNFAPQDSTSASLRRTDTDALVSILKEIERDPRVAHISLVAFNVEETRIFYRQETAEQIDLPALGKALQTMKLGTVDVQRLGQKHSETDFLENLITTEIGTAAHPDAVIFAGPKVMLSADVPQDELRRIGNIECPVFYMNYILNPQTIPWKDSISHAIRTFKGTEFTISRPRDLWFSTTEMVSRIVRRKREKALMTAATGSSQ